MIQLSSGDIVTLLRPLVTEAEIAQMDEGKMTDSHRAALRERVLARQKLLKACVSEGGAEAAIITNLLKRL